MPHTEPEIYANVLALHDLRAQVRLGVDEEERSRPQAVAIDVRFYLPKPLSSSHDDKGEYICYGGVARKIHAFCAQGQYRLIEFLTHEIYRLVRKEIAAEVKLWIRLRKLHIPVECVEGGASYIHTDLPLLAWVAPQ